MTKPLQHVSLSRVGDTHGITGLSVGGALARKHAGTCPNVCLGANDRAPGNGIFPLKRAMSHSGAPTGKLCKQMIFVLKHTL